MYIIKKSLISCEACVAYETNETAIHHPKGFANQMHSNLEGTKISQAKNP
jgi:hypothetical protein